MHLVLKSPPCWSLKEYRDASGQLGSVVDHGRFVGELVMVFVVFAIAIDRRAPAARAPPAIGMAFLVIHLVAVHLTGAGLNAASVLGPAVVSGHRADRWLYRVGPIAGGALAALAYQALFAPEAEDR